MNWKNCKLEFLVFMMDLERSISHSMPMSAQSVRISCFCYKWPFRVHILTMAWGLDADMKGWEQLMGVSTSAYWYCFYCKTRGLHSGGNGVRGHVYCPFTKPPDHCPEDETPNTAPTGTSGPQPHKHTWLQNNSLFVDVNPGNLDLQTDAGFRKDAWQAFNNPHLPQPSNRVSQLPIWC